MREVVLHGGTGDDEAFDRSVAFARRLAESFGARLHVLYTVAEPLSAGWTAEVSAGRMPELHDAFEAEARERLSRFIPLEEQDRLGIEIVLRTGPAEEEIVRYTQERDIDLAIVQVRSGDDASSALARAVLDAGKCALLVIR
jgi:nucleotide-binding universal stress UspA family protein